MNILECFETEAFNELINFSFEEVRAVFNQYKYYVPNVCVEQFITEGKKAKSRYEEELSKIEEYAQGEYTDRVNSGEDIPEHEEPKYKIDKVELQVKSKLVGLIRKYFNKELFHQNRFKIYEHPIFKEEAVETPHELWVSLNVHKDHIYSILSIIGYYQRHRGYFLSQPDFLKICYEYSHQVYCINKNLGMKYRFVNIFISSDRIKSSKSNKSNEDIDEGYQSNKFIDVDKISLLMLVQPYLKHNTQEIKKIIEIMMKNLRGRHGGIAWDKTLDDVNAFIAECESRGIMKRL